MAYSPDVIDARACGCKGDGTTDDTAALQGFCATVEASPHRRGYLPGGTYSFTGAGGNLFGSASHDGVEIFGDGMGKTVLKQTLGVMTADYTVVSFGDSTFIDAGAAGGRNHYIHDFSIIGDPAMSGAFRYAAVRFARGTYNCIARRLEIVNLYGPTDNDGGGYGIYVGQHWNQGEFFTQVGGTGFTVSGAPTSQTCTPIAGTGMQGIYPNRVLFIGGVNAEEVTVTDTTATSFSAVFAHTHLATDPVTVYSFCNQYHLIEDCYIHDCINGTGMVISGNACTFRNNRIVSVGANGFCHGFYAGAGYNLYEGNYVEGARGYNYHIHLGNVSQDASGCKFIGNTSVDPGAGHLICDQIPSTGVNTELPTGTNLNRYITIQGNVFKCNSGAIANGNVMGVNLFGVQGTIVGNTFEDACTKASGNWISAGDATTSTIIKGNIFLQRQSTGSGTMINAGEAGIVSGNILQGNGVANGIASLGNDGALVSENTITGTFATGAIVGAAQIKNNNVLLTSGRCLTGTGSSQFYPGTEISGNVFSTGSAEVVRLNGTETISFHDNEIVAGSCVNFSGASATCRIANNNGLFVFYGQPLTSSYVTPCTKNMGALLAVPKGSATLTHGLLVKFASGVIVPVATSDTPAVFIGICFSNTDTTTQGIYLAGRVGTEFSGLVTDNAWTAGHVGVPSTSVAGQIHDVGNATPPAAPGSYVVFLDGSTTTGSARVLVCRTM